MQLVYSPQTGILGRSDGFCGDYAQIFLKLRRRNFPGEEYVPTHPPTFPVITETDTIFGRGTMPEPSTSHIGQGVALGAPAAVLVYI